MVAGQKISEVKRMTTNEKENTKGESVGIPVRRSEGVAGPSREVSQRDQVVPGAGGAGQEIDTLAWARRHVPDDDPAIPPEQAPGPQPVQEVFRKTELHRTQPLSEPEDLKKLRQQTMQRLKCRDSDLSYRPLVTAFENFICSLVERQDRMEEDARAQIAGLWQWSDTLEDRLERKTGQIERRLEQVEERS
jgi:hypothetical protein